MVLRKLKVEAIGNPHKSQLYQKVSLFCAILTPLRLYFRYVIIYAQTFGNDT